MTNLINTKIVLSGATILAAAALIIGATFAFFSDEETSTGNVFAAGEIDLQIDNESFLNGVLNEGTTWLTPADLDDGAGPAGGAYLFFNFSDVKPGDFGEDTISLHVSDNDSWVCTDVTLTSDNDNGLTDPESEDGDTTPGPIGEGELADAIDFLWWADDGDNVLEDDETTLPAGPIGNLDLDETATVALADSQTNIWDEVVFPGGGTRFIAKAWCFGDIAAAALPQADYDGPDDPANDGDDIEGAATSEDGGFTCDGSEESNVTQSDSYTATIAFRAIQSRNNSDFVCSVPEV